MPCSSSRLFAVMEDVRFWNGRILAEYPPIHAVALCVSCIMPSPQCAGFHGFQAVTAIPPRSHRGACSLKTVATFEIKYQQYLDPEGKLTQKQLPKFAEHADELLKMYRMMSLVRVFDTKAIALQRTEIGRAHV